ncbi:hypothetical protein PsYK624_044460 [Phanerochaete sordida]|uniref:Uncharacterized protein n=1 Tax=Phanerochaete sordida TaxID=48140 RepID=A0A9P3LBR4_9APHY|nr:hypothetical protein PsYK624_044460 [Phanerochaete sordida]
MLPGVYVSETLTKPFRFRSLVFNDEQGIRDPRCYTWENTGSIEFAVFRCRPTGLQQFRPQDPAAVAAAAPHGIVRAPTPALATGGEVPIKAIQGVGGVTIDPPDKPYARILIRYRPREILQMQGAIPTTSSRPTSSSSTAVSQLGRKRSLDSVSLLAETSRPSQRARDTPPTETSPPRLGSSHSHSSHSRHSSGAWGTQPAADLQGSGAHEELALMKSQLEHATDQMHSAMRQMRGSMELMNRSLRQMQFLQQRIEGLEARQPPLPPPPSATLPPIETAHQSPPPPVREVLDEQAQPPPEAFTSFAESPERWTQEQELFDDSAVAGELQWP